jgi:flagellar protein FlaF
VGFSVSGTFALVFAGVFIVGSMLYGTAANNAEQLQEATHEQHQQLNAVAETAIDVTDVQLLASGCGVAVLVNNTGDTELLVNDTDLLLDGTYQTGWEVSATVDGDASTDLWLPGERLNASVDGLAAAPERVKVVSGPGVAGAQHTEALTC